MTISTDRNVSIAAEEFVWIDSDVPPSHRYLSLPTLQALQKARAHKVLDIGCGNGATAAFLRSEGFVVQGCDASESGIAHARRAHPEIDFFEHNIQCAFPPEIESNYDGVVTLEVVEHLLLPRELLVRARQALRPGGVLVMSTPFHGYWKNLALAITNRFDNHWHPLRDFGHVKFFSKATILSLVRECGFLPIDFVRVGRLPTFACSMIVVAQKPITNL